MTIGLNMGQIPPDWEWTDAFGDTMQFNRAGENVVLTVVRRRDGDDYDHACVSLNPAQQRALRAALFGIGTNLTGKLRTRRKD